MLMRCHRSEAVFKTADTMIISNERYWYTSFYVFRWRFLLVMRPCYGGLSALSVVDLFSMVSALVCMLVSAARERYCMY